MARAIGILSAIALCAGCGAPRGTSAMSDAGVDAAAAAADASSMHQPVALVESGAVLSWDGVYPWSLVLVEDAIYYTDAVLGAGYVWKVAKSGGAVEPAIPLVGQAASVEYC